VRNLILYFQNIFNMSLSTTRDNQPMQYQANETPIENIAFLLLQNGAEVES